MHFRMQGFSPIKKQRNNIFDQFIHFLSVFRVLLQRSQTYHEYRPATSSDFFCETDFPWLITGFHRLRDSEWDYTLWLPFMRFEPVNFWFEDQHSSTRPNGFLPTFIRVLSKMFSSSRTVGSQKIFSTYVCTQGKLIEIFQCKINTKWAFLWQIW